MSAEDRYRRIWGWIFVVAGFLLLGAGVGETYVGMAAERVADLVRPEMTDAGLAQHRADFEVARRVFEGLDGEVLPALAGALGSSPDALERELAIEYPAVGEVLRTRAELVAFAEAGVTNLERQQADFERADRVPVPRVPGFAGGVADVVFGLAVAGAGVHLMRRRGSFAAPELVVIGAVAAVMVVVPLAFGTPRNAASAASVLGSLNPSEQVVRRTETSVAVADAAQQQLKAGVIPDLAAAFGVREDAFELALARQFPLFASDLQKLPEVSERYRARVAIRTGGAEELRLLKRIPVGPLGWFGPAAGSLLAAAVAGAVLTRPRDR